jgi:hypothetical protein
LPRRTHFGLACLLIVFFGSARVLAQTPDAEQQEKKAEQEKNHSVNWQPDTGIDAAESAKSPLALPRNATNLGSRFVKDQVQLWTFPAHLTWADADLLVPFGMATGALLATDTETSKHLSNSPSRMHNSLTFSDVGVGTMIGAGAGLYVWGRFTHDEHKKETGFLAGEAALNAIAITEALKYSFGRLRPLDQPQYQGTFRSGGSSMPSEHAAVAWAVAAIIAHEYPGQLTGVLAYGLAGAVGMSRVTAKQHFPSDVLIGSLIGWYAAKQAYRAHHDPELGGSEWLSYGEFSNEKTGERTASLGTTFVPLDSWIYPAMKRLVALGYIRSQFLDMQPWTRLECARLVQEAGERISDSSRVTDEVRELYTILNSEFASDAERLPGGSSKDTSARFESAYIRLTDIHGSTLHDSYHFGQTIIDDFGRPYGSGMNAIAGASGWVTQGRFSLYVRGEYEYAPSSPTYSPAVNNAIAAMDNNPVQPGTFPSVSQFRLMDTYVSSNQANWMLSFGKQSLWWSPDYSNAFLMSNNAAPIYMFRASRIAPFEIPLLSQLLGPAKVDFFIGKLSGNQFPARPVLHGAKITFKPSSNFEVGFSVTSEMGGVGRPITPKSVWLSYTSFASSVFYGAISPGKRMSGFDFSYRIPGLRNWLTIYNDSFATDNTSPLADFNRSAVAPGLYLTHFPKLSKLDLRAEAAYTNTPVNNPNGVAGGKFNYYDNFYHDLYTNRGFLIGSWVGREGNAYQGWMTYHASARNSIQLGYRHSSVSSDFIPGGGNINDASATVNWWLRDDLSVTTLLQYEKWNYPILAPGPQTNWTSSVGFSLYPRALGFPSRSGSKERNAN